MAETATDKELAELEARFEAAASLPLEQLAAMPCVTGAPHRWNRRKCKVCHVTDFRAPAPVPPAQRDEPGFSPAEHRKAVRHAILTGQVLGSLSRAPSPLPVRPSVG